MSDEEDDYNSSDESSGNEYVDKKNDGKPRVLTLEDNDDDDAAFHRPDLIDVYEEGEEEGESDGDIIEEDDTLDLDADGKSKSKKTSLTKKNSTRLYNGKPVLARNSNATSRADSEDQKNKKKKKVKKITGICVTATKYDCVRRVGRKLGFKEVEENEDWTLFWTDTSVSVDRVNQMKRWQKINHYPGMSEICRKDFLTRNMNRMAKLYPKDYTFYPKAWCLPADYADLANYARLKKNKTYICKPDSGCQGKGIFITKNPYKDIKPGDNYVAQVYVSRPFTIDGYKFDLRVYVAVTSCDPFRIFVYKEGLARFTTQQYEEPTQTNCKDVFMHLTNYAIQKRSDDFIRDEETGTKRRISTINKWLKEHGYDVDKLWADIDEVIIKTLLSAHAVLKHSYRTCFANHYKGSACFEILGYDVLIDKKLKPYVLEVNHSPSFTTDSKLDREIKDALIYDTIMLMNIGAMDKKKCVDEERKRVRERLFLKAGKKESKEELDDIQQEWLKQIEKWEDKHMGNFRRIYPAPGSEKYDKFYNNTGTLFSETAASRARIEQAKHIEYKESSTTGLSMINMQKHAENVPGQQMDEIARKNDAFMVNRDKKNQRIQNREVRGESPIRKTSTYQPNSSLGPQHKLSNQSSTNANNSIPSTPANKIYPIPNKLSQAPQSQAPNQQRNPLMSLNNVESTSSHSFQTLSKKIERSNSNSFLPKQNSVPNYFQQINSPGLTKHPIALPSTPQLPIESWKPIEINELDEMERLQSLKQRESLLKGMGISDIVNKMLFGTSGTMATLPPSLVVNPNDFNNNSNNNNHEANSKNGYGNNPKYEIKTKNYNPFENQYLFTEKYLTNQQALRNTNLSGSGVRATKLVVNNNTSSLALPNSNINNSNINGNNNNNVNNRNKGISQIEGNTSSQYRYQFSILNSDTDSVNGNSTANNTNQRNDPKQQNYYGYTNSQYSSDNNKKGGGNRFPIELFQKNESNLNSTHLNNATSINQQTNLLNSFRIRSAQNAAKQRATANLSGDKENFFKCA